MTYSKPIFDLFDNNYNYNYNYNFIQQQQLPNNKFIEDYSMSPTNRKLNTTNSSSSTSINSLFESIPTRSISTTTITPILSRHNSTKQQPPSRIDYDFTKIIDSKLKEHEIEKEAQDLKLVVLLVGLPASGKSTICNQFKNYINNYTKYQSKIFNAGDIRRKNSVDLHSDSNFFNPNNLKGLKDRELYATITLNNLIDSINSNEINCGFLDATNTTLQRRQRMINLINESISNVKIIILDVQCNDSNLLKFNINGKTTNNDYKNKDYQIAINDFNQRTIHYKKMYQPITIDELKNYKNLNLYIKILNGGESTTINKINEEEKEEEKEEKDNDNEFKDWIEIINDFKDNYLNLEYTKYLEMANKWLNN